MRKRHRTQTESTRVVIYARVSTAGQADSGLSLSDQRERAEAYAKLYGLQVIDVVEDAGASAKTMNRPGLLRALAMLKAGEADGLVVAKLDRLTRSVRNLGELLDRYFADGRYALLSVGEQIDTRTASGRLVLNVLASVAQWEREAISERTTHALRQKRKRGERVGTVPYGLRAEADGKVAEDPEEQAVLMRMQSLRARGTSLRGIVAELNRAGPPARGKKWHLTSVARMLAGSELRL